MLFTIHHTAGSGGSIISKAISAATNSILLSEINPFGSIGKGFAKPFFDPTSVLFHLTLNSQEISNELKLQYFHSQLDISINHSISISKNLIIRDHTHSTYNFLDKEIYFNEKHVNSLFMEAIKNYYDIRNLQKTYPRKNPILSVRHPLDNFISARKQTNWLQTYCGLNISIDNYCKALVKMQKYMTEKENAKVVRYEDLCIDLEKTLYEIFDKSEEFFEIPSMELINNIRVTGESGRKSNKIEFRNRFTPDVDTDLIEQINKSIYYEEFCSINNYNTSHKDFPLKDI